MEEIMIYKISPDPSFPKRGKKVGLFQRGGEKRAFAKEGGLIRDPIHLFHCGDSF